MELNLRKARKLEAKILEYVTKMELKSAVKVRVMGDAEERRTLLARARSEFLKQVSIRNELSSARFSIRKAIGDANQTSGINSLINAREELTAYLSLSTANVDAIDFAEAEDQAVARKTKLLSGDTGYDSSVTVTLPVSTETDVASFKDRDAEYKRGLENLEDKLAQKNLGVTVSLPDSMVELLSSVGLL